MPKITKDKIHLEIKRILQTILVNSKIFTTILNKANESVSQVFQLKFIIFFVLAILP